MRVVYLAAGAAGMYCGSCLRDNRLVATLRAQGRDVTLMPLYTPIRTDEHDVSERRVFYGGVNVYLQQKSALFRALPRVLDRVLDSPRLLRGLTRLAASTRPEGLGAMTVSVLRGEDGLQRKEAERLLCELRGRRPQIVNLPNLFFAGIARKLKTELGCRVVCTLSGEDLFLDALPQPYRAQASDLIRARAADVDAFVAVTRYFADYSVARFGLPPEAVHHVPMGVAVEDLHAAVVGAKKDAPFTIAYLARVCPEKGLLRLVEALAVLRGSGSDCRVRAAGWLGAGDRSYFELVRRFVQKNDLSDRFDYLGEVDRRGKAQLLQSAHVLSVPTAYHEAKGLYVLEALAAGVPVVQPRHGAFPELVDDTGGGLLYDPADVDALPAALMRLMNDEPLRARLAARGRAAVAEKFTATVMAERTWALYEALVASRPS
ncbi:MAG: glycosyltransferase family 4 protein [Phycisphaerae bacterium]|jgi:glycosyltransferase involved in cell wall biosynthesis